MLVDEQLCIGCGECIPYCTAGALSLDCEIARVDLDECVECSACVRAGVCPVDALYQQPLEWPRVFRAQFSDQLSVHPETGIPGRGTEEIKTNDLTNRVGPGFASIAVEVGRPHLGARLAQVETIAMALSRIGVEHKPLNPITSLMVDKTTGKLRDDVLNEKVLSAIIEFVVPQSRVLEVLDCLKAIEPRVDTVFSVDLAVRYELDGTVPIKKVLEEAAYRLSPNGKTNVGMALKGGRQ